VLKPLLIGIILTSSDIKASNEQRYLMAYDALTNKIEFVKPEMFKNEPKKEQTVVENKPKMGIAEKSGKIFTYLADKSDKIISKKFAVALALTLGAGYYGAHKIIPLIMDKFTQKAVEVTTKGALQIGSNVSTGFMKAVMDNKIEVAKIAGTALAYKTAEKAIEQGATSLVPYLGKGLAYVGGGALAVLGIIIKYNIPSLIIM
jgi:hypothetical protein